MRVEADLLVAEDVGEGDLRVAVEVTAAGDAEANGRATREHHLLERALLVDVVAQQRVAERRP